MLSKIIMPFIEPLLERGVAMAEQYNISRRKGLMVSLGLMVLCFLFVAIGMYALGLIMLLGNRYITAVTKRLNQTQETEFQNFTLMFSDYALFGGFIFFMTVSPDGMAVPGLFLFLAYFLNETAQLSFDRTVTSESVTDSFDDDTPIKKLFGLIDPTMLVSVFVVMCLIPGGFPFWAVILGFLCFASAVGRFMEVKLMTNNNVETAAPSDETDMDGEADIDATGTAAPSAPPANTDTDIDEKKTF